MTTVMHFITYHTHADVQLLRSIEDDMPCYHSYVSTLQKNENVEAIHCNVIFTDNISSKFFPL